MTCLEKYLKENPGTIPGLVVLGQCPHHQMAIDVPEYCTGNALGGRCGECWNRQIPGTEPDPQPTGTTEAVNHPKHYVREGAMECIDEMLLVFGKEAVMNFCLLNAWKYRYRAADKNGAEDLKKSDWYLAVYADLKGGD